MRRLLAATAVLALAGCADQMEMDPSAHRFVVFFQSFSAALDDPAQQTIKSAAAEFQAHPDERLLVVGFADPVGSKAANDALSQTRAQVVADQLATDGVAPPRILIRARGETPYTLSSQESRRVEIIATR